MRHYLMLLPLLCFAHTVATAVPLEVADGLTVSPLSVVKLYRSIDDPAPGRWIDLRAETETLIKANELKLTKDGSVQYAIPDTMETVWYRELETLDNGMRPVLLTWNGGGSGLFRTIMVFKQTEGLVNALDPKAGKFNRIELVGWRLLNSEAPVSVRVSRNSIVMVDQAGDESLLQVQER